MHLVLIAVAILIITGGRMYQSRTIVKLSDETTPTPTTNTTMSPTSTLTPSAIPTIIKSTSTKAPDAKLTEIKSDEWWIYPIYTKIDKNTDRVQIWSKEAANKIADWYESKIKDRQAKNKTIIRTTANGRAKILITAIISESSYKISIEQANSSSESVITISFAIDSD